MKYVLGIDGLVVEASLSPDLVLILDLPAEESLARATGQGQADNFEARGLDFQKQVRSGYAAYAKNRPATTALIDVDGLSPDQVETAIDAALSQLFENV